MKPVSSNLKVDKALESSSMLAKSGCSEWLCDFKIPTNFSYNTMKALESGEKSRITNSVRREIIYHISTLALVHTREPSGAEYSQLCEILIKKYPVLADNWGTGYVSICHCLQHGSWKGWSYRL